MMEIVIIITIMIVLSAWLCVVCGWKGGFDSIRLLFLVFNHSNAVELPVEHKDLRKEISFGNLLSSFLFLLTELFGRTLGRTIKLCLEGLLLNSIDDDRWFEKMMRMHDMNAPTSGEYFPNHSRIFVCGYFSSSYVSFHYEFVEGTTSLAVSWISWKLFIDHNSAKA